MGPGLDNFSLFTFDSRPQVVSSDDDDSLRVWPLLPGRLVLGLEAAVWLNAGEASDGKCSQRVWLGMMTFELAELQLAMQ